MLLAVFNDRYNYASPINRDILFLHHTFEDIKRGMIATTGGSLLRTKDIKYNFLISGFCLDEGQVKSIKLM